MHNHPFCVRPQRQHAAMIYCQWVPSCSVHESVVLLLHSYWQRPHLDIPSRELLYASGQHAVHAALLWPVQPVPEGQPPGGRVQLERCAVLACCQASGDLR
jgi:hypothetical protein